MDSGIWGKIILKFPGDASTSRLQRGPAVILFLFCFNSMPSNWHWIFYYSCAQPDIDQELYFIRVILLQLEMMEATRGWKVASLTWDQTLIPGFAAGFATDGL